MSKYELDDADAAFILDVLVERDTRPSRDVAKRIAAQIPVPTPVKVGAVVRTAMGVFVRWATDTHTHSPWLQANSDQPYRTDEIGRITEILSSGVDVGE